MQGCVVFVHLGGDLTVLQGPPSGVAGLEAVRTLTGDAMGGGPPLPPDAPRLSWSREPTLMNPSPLGDERLLAKPGEAGGARAGEAGDFEGEAAVAVEGRDMLLAKPTEEEEAGEE